MDNQYFILLSVNNCVNVNIRMVLITLALNNCIRRTFLEKFTINVILFTGSFILYLRSETIVSFRWMKMICILTYSVAL